MERLRSPYDPSLVYTYKAMNVWFWPTLRIHMVLAYPTYTYGSGLPYVYIWFWPEPYIHTVYDCM